MSAATGIVLGGGTTRIMIATAARRGSVGYKFVTGQKIQNTEFQEKDRTTHELLAKRLLGEALCGFGEGHTTANAPLSLVFL